MMGPVRRDFLAVMCVVSACGLLGACGHSGSDSAVATVKRHSNAKAPGAADAADNGPTDLVAAVSTGAPGDGFIGLKFQVAQRPVAGQPLLVTLRLVANQPIEHLEARFRADEGLDISQGGDFDPEGHMDAGATVDHALTVVPAKEGVYTVMATVTSDSSTAESVSRSFVIPIVVGGAAPAPDAIAAKTH